jgi:hypothetical protein
MNNVTQEVWKDMAGPFYDELVQSKEKALTHLSNPDSHVRIAAISVCDLLWNCSVDAAFVDACRTMARTDPDDSVRIHAIEAYGKALQSSQDRAASQFLADLVKARMNSEQVRMAAYWALREIQMGSTDHDVIKRAISLLKLGSRQLPTAKTEEQLKHELCADGHHVAGVNWDFADQIDWDFVNRYASQD